MNKEKIFRSIVLLACIICLTAFVESLISNTILKEGPPVSYTVHCPAEATPIE